MPCTFLASRASSVVRYTYCNNLQEERRIVKRKDESLCNHKRISLFTWLDKAECSHSMQIEDSLTQVLDGA